MLYAMLTAQARFESKYIPEPMSGCWLWLASTVANGYGRFSATGRRLWLAHRYSYELYVGPIPDGMMVLHRCDTRSCVNPDHLYLGTHDENMRDMVRRGRHVSPRRSATHCKRNHQFTEENTYRPADGRRRCRLCLGLPAKA